MSNSLSRNISINRAAELKDTIADFLEYKKTVPTGYKEWEKIKNRQEYYKQVFGASDTQWYDWKWQLRNRICEVEQLEKFIKLSPEEKKEIFMAGSKFRWAVAPYYLSLADPDNPADPIRLQSVPSAKECADDCGVLDPMAEEYTSPAPAITRRYPDRLIINVTNQCASYCRHCQRRRNIGEIDCHTPQKDLEDALKYVANNEEIRDVLLTGGDAMMLSEKTLDWILTELDNIPHVEIKRLGSRVPVTLPYRITDELCEMLSRHLPLYVNTQFNHPMEVTPDAGEACLKLAKCGIALGNQSVLLKGINNEPFLMKVLNQELLKIMVKPYLLFHAKAVQGTMHFRTRVEEGIEIMEQLRGYTSGLAIPTYIVNAPHGYGKTPMFPEYLISMGKNKLLIRTWEKRILEYDNADEDTVQACV